MNWKLIIVGGLVFYVVMFVVSMVTGPVVHQGILLESYQATMTPFNPSETTAGRFWSPDVLHAGAPSASQRTVPFGSIL